MAYFASSAGPSSSSSIYTSKPAIRTQEEAALEAAQTAEFNEKKWVWIEDESEGYLSGWIQELQREDGPDGGAPPGAEKGDGATPEEMETVVLANGGGVRLVPSHQLSKMNPPKFDRVDDIADLTYLNEASVVHNLKLRFGSSQIYTYSGLFLISLNPYTTLPIYTPEIVASYRAKRKEERSPHIFATAEAAWVAMVEQRECQSILITGESGAGKTENTKKVIQYLASVASSVGEASQPMSSVLSRSSSSQSIAQSRSAVTLTGIDMTSLRQDNAVDELGLLERQILQANPILEAFGNAQTLRNNNSSRFGKFIRLLFNSRGAIVGANIDWYLLEKSRVTARAEGERNFHVFYQLLKSGRRARLMREKLHLTEDPNDYQYLATSRLEIDGVDDEHEWRNLQTAMTTVGFSPEEAFEIFRIIAAILHIGNIEITQDYSGQAQIASLDVVEKACSLLGVETGEFMRAVLRPTVKAGREMVTQARNKSQATDELGALCKTMYEKAFGALVDRINRTLDKPGLQQLFVGVLDIAGFEIFEVNGYEQLLINYTNERLQQFFNHHMFVLEQDEYKREQIEWTFVNFGLDLQPTIDLIESARPIGILPTLDEECIMPKATDETFLDKIKAAWSKVGEEGEARFKANRFNHGFFVRHYAGSVEYAVNGWLNKNKDPINDNVAQLLSRSKSSSLSKAFEDYGESIARGGKMGTVKRGAFRTVSQRHRQQLNSLISQLQSTQPHFVRCIVPNTRKKPGQVDVPLVLDQLRCNGVLEGIRIARLGYPNRILFAEFRQRYEVMLRKHDTKGMIDSRKATVRIVESLKLDPDSYRIGLTKIFFRAGALAGLESLRDSRLFDIFARFQSAARRSSARRKLNKLLNRASAIKTIQQNAKAFNELRSWPWWQLYVQMRPLLKATKEQEESKRRQEEMIMAQERAKQDTLERERSERIQAELLAEKRQLLRDLEIERTAAADKETLLSTAVSAEQTTREQLELALQEIARLKSEATSDKARLTLTEQSVSELKAAIAEKEELHKRDLDGRDLPWQRKNADLAEKLLAATQSRTAMQAELSKVQDQLKDRHSELLRLREDMDSRKAAEEKRLLSALHKLEDEKKTRTKLEAEVARLKTEADSKTRQLQEIVRASDGVDAQMKALKAQLLEARGQHDDISQQKTTLKRLLDEAKESKVLIERQLSAAQLERQRVVDREKQTQRELDGLRLLMSQKSTAEAQTAESRRSLEKEVDILRKQAADAAGQLQEGLQKAATEKSSLQRDVQRLRELETTLRAQLASSDSQQAALKEKLMGSEQTSAATAKIVEELKAEVAEVRGRLLKAHEDAQKYQRLADDATRSMKASKTRLGQFEEAIQVLESRTESTMRELRDVKRVKEQRERELADTTSALQVAASESAATKTVISGLQDEIQALKANEQKVIHEHRHLYVLAEAKKVTDRQLAETEQKLEDLRSEHRLLKQQKSRVNQDYEDASRQSLLLKKELAEATGPLKSQLRAEVEARNLAESKVSQLESQISKIKDLEKRERERPASRVLENLHKANLEMAGDMAKALSGQVQESKQVEAALSGEIERLKVTLAKSERDAISRQKANEDAAEKIISMRTEIQHLRAKHADASAHITSLTGKLEKSAAQVKEAGKLQQRLDSAERQMAEHTAKHQRELTRAEEAGRAQANSEKAAYESTMRELEMKIVDMRDKYQDHLQKLSEDLALQRKEALSFKEANKQLKKREEELRELLDSELHSSDGWRSAERRMQARIDQANQALQSEKIARQQAEDRHASHLTQIKDLNAKVIDLEAECTALREAKRRLLARAADGEFEPSKLSNDRLLQTLHSEKQELKSALAEAEDRMKLSREKQARLEAYASESKAELGKVRHLNAELDRRNSQLENENKSLQVRLVDLETKLYTSSPRGGSMVPTRRRP